MTTNAFTRVCRLATDTLSMVALAAIVGAVPAAHAADKRTRPAEVQGVKLTSICVGCAVVSSVRMETVKGKGSGQAAETAASDAAAATRSVKTATVWATTVVFKNGTTQTYQQRRNPGLHAGDVVTIEDGVPTKYVP